MNVALITEGVSEHRVMKHIISKYLKDIDVDINQIQPRVENNKQATDGGWNEVLKFCASIEMKTIFGFNDLAIIQIDTDLCETYPFSIPHTSSNGQPKTYEQLYNDVLAKLISQVPSDIYEKYRDKIIFAICIHSIECWLLPIYGRTAADRSSVANCVSKLNTALARKNMYTIPAAKNSANGIKAYNELLKGIKKVDLTIASGIHYSLRKFMEELNKRLED